LKRRPTESRQRTSRGQNLVEFSLSCLMLVILLLTVFEFGRMLLIYTTVANAARIGTRYAEVHGSQSSAAYSSTQITAVVKNYLSAAPMNTSSANLFIDVSPTSGAGAGVGATVTVTVNYKYDPFMTYFPLGVYLASTSQGVIAF
jgi:Flp pilus assembly protein TadG